MPQKASQKQNFLQGALILSLGTALVKIIGALFKVPLQNLIGPVGMANFNAAYTIYTTLFVISTAGLPVAVSKMVSEAGVKRRPDEARAVFRTALSCFVVIGALGSCLLFFGARTAAGWMNNPDAYMAVQAIAPAILFVGIMSAFRGFYQGQGNMVPTAVSQVFEALCKLGIGYALASWIFNSYLNANAPSGGLASLSEEALKQLKNLASEPAAAGAIAGISIGAVVGALYLMLRYRRQKMSLPSNISSPVRPRRDILKELLRLAIPVTISASVLNLTNLIDIGMVNDRLQSVAENFLSMTPEMAKTYSQELYGSYTFAQTLFNLPPAFILTFSVSIIPALSAALAKRDRLGASRTISSALRITSLLAMPAAAGLSALSFPILNLLSGVRQPEAVAIAAPLLTMLGYAVPFVCLVSLTNAILQSMGKVSIPILTMLVGGVCKIVVNYVLVGNPDININGAPIGTLVCYAVIAALNLAAIIRYTHAPRLLTVFIKPLAASALMGAFAYIANTFLVNTLRLGSGMSVILAIFASVVFYLFMIYLLRALPSEDVLLLPKGDKIAKWLRL